MTTPFLQRAAQLGHSAELLQSGQSVSTQIEVPHIDALKSFIAPDADVATRQSIGLALFGPPPTAAPEADPSGQGVLARVNAYLYDHAELADSDRARIASVFPLSLSATSVSDKVVDGLWDLGTSQPGILTYNIGTLTINDGGWINVRNSVLDFSADTVVRTGAAPFGSADFNILGVDGGPGTDGAPRGPGGSGSQGSNGTCASPGVQGDSGGSGGGGPQGGGGNPGLRGGDGLPSMAATFTFTTAITGTLTFQSKSGGGGQGGAGGPGGQGGTGGPGGGGATCGCEGTNGGPGGAGGKGGTGGTGGAGGNAVSSVGKVLIKTTAALLGNISQNWIRIPATGGKGGVAGAGGTGGAGGGGGGGGKHQDDGGTGGWGGPGDPGTGGADNTMIGAPADFTIQPL